MTRRALATGLALVGLAGALAAPACSERKDRQSPDELRKEIAALEKERDLLRPKLDQLVAKDPRIAGMPKTPVRVGVPTTLARDLVERVTSGFIDHVTLELKNLKVNKKRTVKKVVTLGEYELHVLIKRVSGRLKTGKPSVTFGGNRIELSMPVTVASGTGNATIDFKWDGKGVSDAVCGDMEITRDVSGGVKPASYPVSGALVLTATAEQILAEPKFPLIKINLKVDPSDESWAAVQKILDDQEGICGYVVDKVNILKIVQGLIDKGFNVRLPTEKIKPMAVPVGIEPSMNVKGRQVDARDQGRRARDHRGHDLARRARQRGRRGGRQRGVAFAVRVAVTGRESGRLRQTQGRTQSRAQGNAKSRAQSNAEGRAQSNAEGRAQGDSEGRGESRFLVVEVRRGCESPVGLNQPLHAHSGRQNVLPKVQRRTTRIHHLHGLTTPCTGAGP